MEKHLIKKGLVFAVIILFICLSITPSTAVDNVKKPPTPTFDGSILYVGGSGPDNYTRIQDAIDDASDGDMVFVYDDSSPYYENISINNSINLIGENKNTTIIDCKEKDWSTIEIGGLDNYVSSVTIKGFTIRGGNTGIATTHSSFCVFENNIISSMEYGIFLGGTFGRDNVIKNNIISNNEFGICIYFSGSNISYNYISNNSDSGIYIWSVDASEGATNISYNQILNNGQCGIRTFYGIGINKKYDKLIYKPKLCRNIISNNISFNEIGIYINSMGLYSPQYRILKNNFINNNKSAFFEVAFPLSRNIWYKNYWNRTRFLPYPIFGIIGYFFPHKWINFDWHPAKKPYDL